MTAPLADDVWSVAQLAAHVNETITDSYGTIWLKGEVAEFKAWASGHWYFKLREGEAQLSCVMWKWANAKQRPPEAGQEVFALVEPGLYQQRGEFRLTVKRMIGTADIGSASKDKERVRQALLKDGLFALERKRPLPAFPTRVAIVTSASGAALQDMLTVTRRRWPIAELFIVPCLVQGAGAPDEIIAALGIANRIPNLDVCIVGRGGGAKEDLAAFDNEAVCRAVAEMVMPVVSAVGHETDTSFCDLVADVRAATPSQAAELVFPDLVEVTDGVRQLGQRLRSALERRTGVAVERVERAGDRLEAAMAKRVARRRDRLAPIGGRLAAALGRRASESRTQTERLGGRLIGALQQRVGRENGRQAEQRERLRAAILRRLALTRAETDTLGASLQALSPLQVLDRGYAIPRSAEGDVLRRRKEFLPNQLFTLRVADGDVAARVESA